jgi:hypothetical protein
MQIRYVWANSDYRGIRFRFSRGDQNESWGKERV